MIDLSKVSNDNFGLDDETMKEIISNYTLFPNPYNSGILLASDYDDEDEDDFDDEDLDEEEEDLLDEDDLEEEGYEEDFDFDEEEEEDEDEDLGKYN